MATSYPNIRFPISKTKKGECKSTVVPVPNEASCHEGIWRNGDVLNSVIFSVSALDGGEWSAVNTGRSHPSKGDQVPTAWEGVWLYSRSGHFTPSGNRIGFPSYSREVDMLTS
jgi:hypothetical protein